MDLTIPTGVLVVGYDRPSNCPHEDAYVAIRNAFRAARRELDAHREASGASASIDERHRIHWAPGGPEWLTTAELVTQLLEIK